jgi:cytochrome bd-type quinol oxidase subunit 2
VDPTATKWDRFLNPFERYGAVVVWVLTVIYVVGFVVLKVRDTNADTLIDVVTIVRAAQVLVLIGVLLAGLAAVREAERSEAGLAARGAA